MGVNGVNLYRLVCYWVSQVYSDIEFGTAIFHGTRQIAQT
jgi:hypothetical protein